LRIRMEFCTAINCMDGRVQLPVITYLQNRFNAEHVDIVSEPGPNHLLANRHEPELVNSILNRVDISVHKHHSRGMAVIGHHDCAGNPASEEEQLLHTREAVAMLREKYPDMEIIGLWVDENWEVSEIPLDS
jgi:Putative carbonic anhydrase